MLSSTSTLKFESRNQRRRLHRWSVWRVDGVSMKLFWMGKRWAPALAATMLTMGALSLNAQEPNVHSPIAQNDDRVQPQATAEDVLAALVHHSAVIFAGEVYAIRMPQGTEMPQGTKGGVSGGVPSSRADAVEVEFRVDVGIRGASIGSDYILRMALPAWQQAPSFTLHQRAVTFLRPADASGLAGPVEGEADLPGMDLGVMPLDDSNQVNLGRLQRLVTRKTITTAAMLPPPGPAQAPSVTDVSTEAGEDTLISGSSEGEMPELRSNTVPFLALVRDITVLSAAEAQQGNGAAK
jgi:hypothetical protein